MYKSIVLVCAVFLTMADARAVDDLNEIQISNFQRNLDEMKLWTTRLGLFIEKTNNSKENDKSEMLSQASVLLNNLNDTLKLCGKITKGTDTKCLEEINKSSSNINIFTNIARRSQWFIPDVGTPSDSNSKAQQVVQGKRDYMLIAKIKKGL